MPILSAFYRKRTVFNFIQTTAVWVVPSTISTINALRSDFRSTVGPDLIHRFYISMTIIYFSVKTEGINLPKHLLGYPLIRLRVCLPKPSTGRIATSTFSKSLGLLSECFSAALCSVLYFTDK